MKATLIHICFFLTFCALTCRAATYYVSLAGTNNSPPFTNSWASAGTDIVAIAASAPAGSGVNTVLVSNGTYYLTNQITPAWGVIIKSFSGRDVTIIDGNYPNYTNRCFKFAGSGNTLDGFTIRNGFSTNSAWNEGGGGVYCNKTYIYNCRIINNVTSNATSQGGGGGILAFGNGCIVTNCDIIANTAYGSGGGLWSQEDGNVVNISGCNIISNKSNGSGGGIRTDSHCSISNCVITYNSADAGG